MAKNINFLFFFFIFCSFLSYSQANNLKDFEIEGISIGDSLLKHFSKINIDKEINSEAIGKNSAYADGFEVSAPIKSFNPNANQLFDLYGNVSEWVHDFYPHPKSDRQCIQV